MCAGSVDLRIRFRFPLTRGLRFRPRSPRNSGPLPGPGSRGSRPGSNGSRTRERTKKGKIDPGAMSDAPGSGVTALVSAVPDFFAAHSRLEGRAEGSTLGERRLAQQRNPAPPTPARAARRIRRSRVDPGAEEDQVSNEIHVTCPRSLAVAPTRYSTLRAPFACRQSVSVRVPLTV